MRCYQIIVTIVTLCIPLPSNQHFIFPVSMCVLADICNHTWIPECARERSDGHLRLFIDECDMFEYNCDHEKYYEVQNYSDCFTATVCPTFQPCPSHPTCPDHRFHRMGQRVIFITQNRRRMVLPPKTTPKITLPYHMLHGKRRYTPIPRIRRERMKKEARRKMTTKAKPTSKIQTTKLPEVLYETLILKRESIVKNGKIFMKVVKAYVTKFSDVTKSMTSKYEESISSNGTKDSDFLEK